MHASPHGLLFEQTRQHDRLGGAATGSGGVAGGDEYDGSSVGGL
jgi:hypothetical protein